MISDCKNEVSSVVAENVQNKHCQIKEDSVRLNSKKAVPENTSFQQKQNKERYKSKSISSGYSLRKRLERKSKQSSTHQNSLFKDKKFKDDYVKMLKSKIKVIRQKETEKTTSKLDQNKAVRSWVRIGIENVKV